MSSRTQAESVPCPRCHAVAGERCFLARQNWRGNIYRTASHQERHNAFRAANPTKVISKNTLASGRGWPNALQARQMVSDEAHRRGKRRFAAELGISLRYLQLVLNHERNPVHPSIMARFGWQRVYEVAPEDDL